MAMHILDHISSNNLLTMSGHSTPGCTVNSSAGSPPSCGADADLPMALTPRSKIKAMLMALDADSDEEHPLSPRKSTLAARTGEQRTEQDRRPQDTSDTDGDGDADGEEDDDDSDVIVPRGKMAARLRGQKPPDEDRVEYSGLATDANAYERVKRQLLQNGQSRQGGPLLPIPGNVSIEDIPMKRRFLTKRKQLPPANSESQGASPKSAAPYTTMHKSTDLTSAESAKATPTRGLSPNPLDFSEVSRVQAHSERKGNGDLSGSDCGPDLLASSRFMALVNKKRNERQEKEAAEEARKDARQLKMKNLSAKSRASAQLSGEDSGSDSATERRLTQQSRPTRKASKKALEEMSRETQRMSRNMQLAHQAKTTKKISKASFLARFNVQQNSAGPTGAQGSTSSSTLPSSAPISDVEGAKEPESPPTSPSGSNGELHGSIQKTQASHRRNDVTYSDDIEDDFAAAEGAITIPQMSAVARGKTRAVDDFQPIQNKSLPKSKKTVFSQPPIKVNPAQGKNTDEWLLESDSDLEIVPVGKDKRQKRQRQSKLDIFDRLPAKSMSEGQTHRKLRMLAHLSSPSKRSIDSRGSMTSSEMQAALIKRSREQAAKERAEKIEELEAKGIIVRSAAERQRDQAEVEDLLEKARREGETVMQEEKAAAKKQRQENGVEEIDSSSDEDYIENVVSESDCERSGSESGAVNEESEEDEEEEEEDEEDDGVEDDQAGGVPIDENRNAVLNVLDDEAIEDDTERESEEDNEEPPDEVIQVIPTKRRSRISRVIEDEDDEPMSGGVRPVSPQSLKKPTLFFLPGSDEAPMGLTQAFAATMTDSQTQMDTNDATAEVEQDSLAFLRGIPESQCPMMESYFPEAVVPDSQPKADSTNTSGQSVPQEIILDLHLSQSQLQIGMVPETDELLPNATQYSEIPDPTQDAGFEMWPPSASRLVSMPPSTVDTVLIPTNDTPIKRKGRLRRRGVDHTALSDADDSHEKQPSEVENGFKISADAFGVLKKAAKKSALAMEPFDKKRSEAKGMVEEQAEESEDEYAGLGGASDDESNAEEDEEVKKMMDDGEVEVNERKLAALFA